MTAVSIPDSYALAERNAPTVNLPTPKRALAIGAHPDDVEFGCGATLAKWASAGCEIFHLVLTDGSKGTWDASVDPAALVATRQREQRDAARALGGRDEHVTFLGWVDGELDSGLRQRWEVAFHIRRVQPDVVLGHDPWRRYRLHPDHRNAGFLTTDGIVAARDPKFFPEQQIAPHRPQSLLLWEADEANHVEDVGDQLDKKLRSLLAHQSQYASTMHIAADTVALDDGQEVQAFRERIFERAADAGRLAGIAHGEAFRLMQRL